MHMITQNQNYLIYVIIMQQENNHPARRQLVYILAVLLPCVPVAGAGAVQLPPLHRKLISPTPLQVVIISGAAALKYCSKMLKAKVRAGFPLLRAIAAISLIVEKFKIIQNYRNFLIQNLLITSPQDFQKSAISALKLIISKIPGDIFYAGLRQV